MPSLRVPRLSTAAAVTWMVAVIVTTVTTVTTVTAATGADAQVRVNPDAQQIADFTRRVDEYGELHRKLEGTLPARPDRATPEQIDTHQRALSRLIVQARGRAQQGDIFTRETRAYFRRQMARALAGPDGSVIRSSIMDENPGRIQLRVNGRYPDEVPVSSMPPQILAVLPKLPPDLEYRFLGDRLLLLDVHANIVIDYIDKALP